MRPQTGPVWRVDGPAYFWRVYVGQSFIYVFFELYSWFCQGVHLSIFVRVFGRLDSLVVFVLGEDVGDGGFAESYLFGDFSAGVAVFAEQEDLGFGVVDFVWFFLAEVFGFGGEFPEAEFEEATVFLDFIDEDVSGVITEGADSDFDLFDVAEAFVFGGLADAPFLFM